MAQTSNRARSRPSGSEACDGLEALKLQWLEGEVFGFAFG